jgi:hypothetical protein
MNVHESVKYFSMGYGINLPLGVPNGEKISLPVSSSSYVYSQFKHVMGTPTLEGERGFTISRLKMVDVLIEQMNRLKTKEEIAGAQAKEDTEKTAETIRTELQEMKIRADRPYSPPLALMETSGILFNAVS